MGNTIRMIPPEGGPAEEIPVEKVQIYRELQYTPETNAQHAATTAEAALEAHYSKPENVSKAVLAAGARGLTGGASDAIIRGVGGDDARRELAALREHNRTLSTVVELGTSVLPVGVPGRVAKFAEEAVGIAKGGSAISQIARTGVRGSIEGGAMGLGQGVSELALSAEPITFERATSVLSSNMLYGAATGGVVGAAGKGLEIGLQKAKSALNKYATRAVDTAADGVDDLSKLDSKGLRAAHKAELDAIEAARVPQRAQVADEIKVFRAELKENKLWLATKNAEDAEIRAIGKRTLKADRALDNVLDDPKALAENPKAALANLRKQEAALDDLVNKHGPTLREKFAADASGDRVKALDYAASALEKNRSLQTKITELSSKPTSQRLEAIGDAMEGLRSPKPQSGLGEALGASALGHVVGAAAGVPFLGEAVLAGKAITGVVKKLGVDTAAVAQRASKAIDVFLDVTKRVTPKAPVVASKVLGELRYGPSRERTREKPTKTPTLAQSFQARSSEIRGQIAPGPDGTPQMRPSARLEMSERLAPLRAASPLLADRMESAAARRLEFLASKLPKRPDVMGVQIGPDKWQPSDMEMRTFARYAAAVEDPHGVIERMSEGAITPEDAEAVRDVYPELHADVTRQIIERLPELRKSLPFSKRVALSMFTGVPVDPAMDPRILGILQSTFAAETGSENGTQAPKPEPAFGSVSKETATPAQQRG
jgi:uncharacterized membrane protein